MWVRGGAPYSPQREPLLHSPQGEVLAAWSTDPLLDTNCDLLSSTLLSLLYTEELFKMSPVPCLI